VSSVESPATSYASRVDGPAFSWIDLERHAFAAHPGVVTAITRAADARGLPRRGAARWWPVMSGLGSMVVLLAPVIAPGIIVAFGRGPEGRAVAFAVAGILAFAHLVFRIREWVLLARRVPTGSAREALLAAISIPFGITAAVLAAMAGLLEPPPLIWLWFAAFGAMTLSCAVAIVVLRRASRRGLLEPRHADDEARAAVDALSPSARDAVADDLRSALATLADREVITAADRDAAAASPLGGMARWAWAHGSATQVAGDRR
jgi:hypothetical protein